MTTNQLLDGFILKEQIDSKTKYTPKKIKQDLKEELFGDLFKDISNVKITSIKENVDDINRLMQTREVLKKELFDDIEQSKVEINGILAKVPIDATTMPAVTAEHLKLKQKLIDLEERKMQEKLNCWRDIALLKRELRENTREVQEKENSLGLLDKIIR